MEKIQVKFEEWIERGFHLYKENFVVLALSMLIAIILSTVTAGILVGPMIAGIYLITLALLDRQTPKPEVGTLFKGFRFFLNTFLIILVWSVILFIVSAILGMVPVIGQLAALFVIFAVQTLLMFAIFLIIDQNRDFWPASMQSFETVRTNFWPFLGLFIITSIIGAIGAIACGIGVFLTAPIQACILTVAYRDVFPVPAAAATVPDPTRQP